MKPSRRILVSMSLLLPVLPLMIILFLTEAGATGADGNLLDNGNFSRGSGNSVDEWRTDAWILSAGQTDYRWIRPQGHQPGEIEVNTHLDNDARWVQQLSLTAGWYYISAEARTVGVLSTFTGANVSVLEDGIASADLKGDSDWHKLGLYLKIGPHGADVDVALRLGGYMNLTRGQAFFRNASVIRVPGPPAHADYVYDLDLIRQQEVNGPVGRPWTIPVTFLALGLVAVTGWRMLTPIPRSARVQQSKAQPEDRKRNGGSSARGA
jgi:hypothetical protein